MTTYSKAVREIDDDARAFRKQQVFAMQAQLASQRREGATKLIFTGCIHAAEADRGYLIEW
eukprot:9152699-Lingulodinium_polyedra.AAC.1